MCPCQEEVTAWWWARDPGTTAPSPTVEPSSLWRGSRTRPLLALRGGPRQARLQGRTRDGLSGTRHLDHDISEYGSAAATKFNEQGGQHRGAGEASQAQGRVDQGCWPAAGQLLGQPAACHRGLATLARAEGWVDLGDGAAPGCRGPAGPGRTCCVLGPGKQEPLVWRDREQVTLRGGGEGVVLRPPQLPELARNHWHAGFLNSPPDTQLQPTRAVIWFSDGQRNGGGRK